MDTPQPPSLDQLTQLLQGSPSKEGWAALVTLIDALYLPSQAELLALSATIRAYHAQLPDDGGTSLHWFERAIAGEPEPRLKLLSRLDLRGEYLHRAKMGRMLSAGGQGDRHARAKHALRQALRLAAARDNFEWSALEQLRLCLELLASVSDAYHFDEHGDCVHAQLQHHEGPWPEALASLREQHIAPENPSAAWQPIQGDTLGWMCSGLILSRHQEDLIWKLGAEHLALGAQLDQLITALISQVLGAPPVALLWLMDARSWPQREVLCIRAAQGALLTITRWLR